MPGDYVKTDGSTAMTGNLDMGSNKITSLADGQQETDAANMRNLSAGLSAKPGISCVILRDGSQAMDANLKMFAHRITNLSNGQALYDAATMYDLRQGLNPKPDDNRVVLRNGSQVMAAALKVGAHKITNLADGSQMTDAATMGSLTRGLPTNLMQSRKRI